MTQVCLEQHAINGRCVTANNTAGYVMTKLAGTGTRVQTVQQIKNILIPWITALFLGAISPPAFSLHEPFESCSEAASLSWLLPADGASHPGNYIGKDYHLKIRRCTAVGCDVLCNYMQTLTVREGLGCCCWQSLNWNICSSDVQSKQKLKTPLRGKTLFWVWSYYIPSRILTDSDHTI